MFKQSSITEICDIYSFQILIIYTSNSKSVDNIVRQSLQNMLLPISEFGMFGGVWHLERCW